MNWQASLLVKSKLQEEWLTKLISNAKSILETIENKIKTCIRLRSFTVHCHLCLISTKWTGVGGSAIGEGQ